MSVRSDINSALELSRKGRAAEARELILRLESLIKDPYERIELIDVALSILNNIKDNAIKVTLSLEGAAITEKASRIDLQAHFKEKAAAFSVLQLGVWNHKRSLLKLAPRWFNFSTVTTEKEYESLTILIDELDEQINTLLSDAVNLSDQSGDKKGQASVLMSKGNVEGTRYLEYKMGYLRGWRAKIWSNFEFMRYPFFEYILTFTNGDARKLNSYVKSFSHCFIKAAQLADSINDSMAGYAYHNYAVQLKSAYRFGLARKYVKKARDIAIKYNDEALMLQVNSLEKYINDKNKDIPDYLNGESRDLNI